MKGAKKDKKNGKDNGGGVVAAVTKHAAGKFTLVPSVRGPIPVALSPQTALLKFCLYLLLTCCKW